MENKKHTIEEAVKHLHNGGAIINDSDEKFILLGDVLREAYPQAKETPDGSSKYYHHDNQLGWDGFNGINKTRPIIKLSNISEQSQSEEEGKEPTTDINEIMKLKNGERYVIPESDYGKAEIWLLNDIYVLFSIPYCGGNHTFEKTYHKYYINEMLIEINSWT